MKTWAIIGAALAAWYLFTRKSSAGTAVPGADPLAAYEAANPPTSVTLLPPGIQATYTEPVVAAATDPNAAPTYTQQRVAECQRRGGVWSVSMRPDGVYDATLGVCALPSTDPDYSPEHNAEIYYDGVSFP